MTIFCNACNQAFISTKPGFEPQQREVFLAMNTHMSSKHPNDANYLAQVLSMIATSLLVKNFVRIPKEETALQKSIDDNEQKLLQLFYMTQHTKAGN